MPGDWAEQSNDLQLKTHTHTHMSMRKSETTVALMLGTTATGQGAGGQSRRNPLWLLMSGWVRPAVVSNLGGLAQGQPGLGGDCCPWDWGKQLCFGRRGCRGFVRLYSWRLVSEVPRSLHKPWSWIFWWDRCHWRLETWNSSSHLPQPHPPPAVLSSASSL